MTNIKWKYFKPEDEALLKLNLEPLSDVNGMPTYCRENLHWYEFDENCEQSAFTSAVKEFYDNIYDHLVNNAPLIITPEKNRQMIAVLEEVYRQNPLPVKY